MTPTQLEQGREPTETVDVNMVWTFLLFLVLPYVLFFGLLILLTGQIDLGLLYRSVMHDDAAAVFKAWVIGTFTLSSLGAFFLTAYRTEKYIARHIDFTSKPPKPAGGSVAPYFVIESGESVEASEETKSRHRELNGMLDDREK